MLARPFTRPDSLTSTTLPRTFGPFSRTIFPSTMTGSARVAVNRSPGEVLVVLTPSTRATRRRVPAGTVIFGSGFNLSKNPLGFEESALVSDGLLEHAATLAANAPS